MSIRRHAQTVLVATLLGAFCLSALSSHAHAQTTDAPATATAGPEAASPATVPVEPAKAEPKKKREEEPPTGLGGLILGYGGIGLGAMNLALIPVCSQDFYPNDATDLCIGLSIAYGVIGIGAGIPLAIMGHVRRARYLKWREQKQQAQWLPRFGVLPDPARPQLTASFRF